MSSIAAKCHRAIASTPDRAVSSRHQRIAAACGDHVQNMALHPFAACPQTQRQASRRHHVIEEPQLRRVQQTRIEYRDTLSTRVDVTHHPGDVLYEPRRGTGQLQFKPLPHTGGAMFALPQCHGEHGQKAQRMHLPIHPPGADAVEP